jgi:hypothetical protein
MRNRIVRYSLIAAGIVILCSSTSQAVMRFLTARRDNDTWWGTFQSRNGNLASMAHLDFLEKFHTPQIKEHIKKAGTNRPKKTSLLLFGDSYTWSLRDTNFEGLSSFRFINCFVGGYFVHDDRARNIMIIAIGEARIREYFESDQMIHDVYDSAKKKNDITGIYLPQHFVIREASFIHFPDVLYNKYINQNLEFNLFNYNFMMPLFGLKAAINYYLFKRASGDIIISDDGAYLFHKSTVDPGRISSSYSPLTVNEVNKLIITFNHIYDHFKNCGFYEIYLSIIPGTASIVQPAGYNNLIPQIQNNPHLRMKIIDIYSALKNSGGNMFFHGDSHWNNEGKQKWVDMVNGILIN